MAWLKVVALLPTALALARADASAANHEQKVTGRLCCNYLGGPCAYMA